MTVVRWDIRRTGRAWTAAEFTQRADLRPEKLEISEGKLLWSEEDRLSLLGLLLENVGADQAVRLGNPDVWIAAAAQLKHPWERPRPFLADPFNRWMLLLWCLNLAVMAVVIIAAPSRSELAQASPSGGSVLLCVVVAMWTSLGVHAFLK